MDGHALVLQRLDRNLSLVLEKLAPLDERTERIEHRLSESPVVDGGVRLSARSGFACV
jgi:hypothetical protein